MIILLTILNRHVACINDQIESNLIDIMTLLELINFSCLDIINILRFFMQIRALNMINEIKEIKISFLHLHKNWQSNYQLQLSFYDHISTRQSKKESSKKKTAQESRNTKESNYLHIAFI